LLVATLLSLFLVPFLSIGRAEIVTGDTAVAYTGTITFSVASYIEVDFGPGWKELTVQERIKSGTSGIYSVSFNPDTTYIKNTENSNTGVRIYVGVPSGNWFIQNVTIDDITARKGEYSPVEIIRLPPGMVFRPDQILAGINVPQRTGAGNWAENFILCAINEVFPRYEVYVYCPPL